LGSLTVSNGYGAEIVGGASVPIGVSAGVSLTRALVVFGDIRDDHMLLFDSSNSYDATWFDLYGAGLGLKFYPTPGFFLAGSGSVARLRLGHQGGSSTENSDWGAMARLWAAAEWPVSSRWSVGLGAEYQFGVVHSRGLDPGLPDPQRRKYSLDGLSLLVVTSFHQPAAGASGSAEVAGAPATPPAGYHAHDGLYLNASLGPGWLWVRNQLAVGSGQTLPREWSGRATSLALSAGVAFAHHFVVFGEFSATQVRDPAGEDYLASVEWRGFGPGLRYYLMPANVFLAGSFLLSKVFMYPGFSTRGFSERLSNWGGMGSLSLGKEWWVLSDLGIGAAAEFTFGKLPGNDGWGTYTATGISMAASVSFN